MIKTYDSFIELLTEYGILIDGKVSKGALSYFESNRYENFEYEYNKLECKLQYKNMSLDEYMIESKKLQTKLMEDLSLYVIKK